MEGTIRMPKEGTEVYLESDREDLPGTGIVMRIATSGATITLQLEDGSTSIIPTLEFARNYTDKKPYSV